MERQIVNMLNAVGEEKKRKDKSRNIDTKLTTLKLGLNAAPALDFVVLRPPNAFDVEEWRANTEALVESADKLRMESEVHRDAMKGAVALADSIVLEFGEMVDKMQAEKLAFSVSARDDVQQLLVATKEELARTEHEIEFLETAISEKMHPLSFATQRLATRSERPAQENTIDSVHHALIQEVAELDASVSTLQKELNINMNNQSDLKTMEAMLEEDFGIKKVTVNLEQRCTNIRKFLSPDTDQYIQHRLLTDDEFFDLMTR